MYARIIRLGLSLYQALLTCVVVVASFGRRSTAPSSKPCTIVATGTFFSDNWVRAHLIPLLRSPACGQLVLVADRPSIQHSGLHYRCPSASLRAFLGRVGARSILLLWTAWRTQPQFIIGYHLLPNGLLALLAARLTGAAAIYQCCGGPGELDGGGPAMMENGLLRSVKRPDPAIAAQLRSIVRRFDVIVTRGNEATRFFRSLGVSGSVIAIPAGLDASAHTAATAPRREFDVITVGRLVQVKRIDVFLEVVERLKRENPQLKAAVVGDGPLREELTAHARRLGLGDCVYFAGARDDVASWLSRSKVFLLTSDSEGLSIALAEAMMAGLPAIVSDVGELEALVIDGENGFRVGRGRIDDFARRASGLLQQGQLWSQFSRQARRRAVEVCESDSVSASWSAILTRPLPSRKETSRV